MEEIKRKYIERRATRVEKKVLFNHFKENPEEFDAFVKEEIDYTIQEVEDKNLFAQPRRGKIKKREMVLLSKSVVTLYKIAAIISIPLLITSLYLLLFNKPTTDVTGGNTQLVELVPTVGEQLMEYQVNPGVKGLIDLPDGSRVWLNSGSSLTVPKQFNSDRRELLLSGEAYFDIIGNPEWPLVVSTERGYSVEVLGTQFNLSTYHNDNSLKLTLLSGKVKLINHTNNSEIELDSLQHLVVPIESGISKKRELDEVEASKKSGWKDGLLIFDETPMDEVVRMMERWFGVKIVVQNRDLYRDYYTGQFESESLVQVLEFMKISSNLNYSVRDKIYTLN